MAITKAEVLTALGWTADEEAAAKLRAKLALIDANIAALLAKRGDFAVTSQAREETMRAERATVQALLDGLGKAGA